MAGNPQELRHERSPRPPILIDVGRVAPRPYVIGRFGRLTPNTPVDDPVTSGHCGINWTSEMPIKEQVTYDSTAKSLKQGLVPVSGGLALRRLAASFVGGPQHREYKPDSCAHAGCRFKLQ